MFLYKYISNLLFEYDCVIIPGLGGFVADYAPVKIDILRNSLVPPSKDIVFNASLNVNDGLLAKHISEEEKITFIQANTKIKDCVKDIVTQLESDKKIHIPEIGTLSGNAEGNILFEPENSVNFALNSFGLTKITSPPIKRETLSNRIERKIEKKIVSKEAITTVERKMPKPVKWATVGALPLLLVIMLFSFNNSLLNGLYVNYSSIVSSFISSDSYVPPAPVVVKEEQKKEIVEVISKPIEKEKKEVVIKHTPKPSAPIIDRSKKPIVKSYIAKKKYYIIAGSFSNKKNAKNLLNKLKKKGYTPFIVSGGKKGYYRVSYTQPITKTIQADKMLSSIKKIENDTAWMHIQ